MPSKNFEEKNLDWSSSGKSKINSFGEKNHSDESDLLKHKLSNLKKLAKRKNEIKKYNLNYNILQKNEV